MSLTGLPNILHDIQSRTSWQQRCQYLLIAEKWAEIVGDSVAKQTSPIGVYQKTLQVAVSSAVWSQALSFERIRILAKVNALVGGSSNLAITDIHFSTAKWATHQQDIAKRTVIAEDHPSYLPAIPNVSKGVDKQKSSNRQNPERSHDYQKPPETASEAFQRWQSVMKLRAPQMPKCPKCDRPALAGEISRWQMCRVCAIEYLFK
jgi:predicted nucleic acid-binding Zn ribbon protein